MKPSVMQGKSLRSVVSGGYTAAVDDGKQQSAPAQSAQADEALGDEKSVSSYLLYL